MVKLRSFSQELDGSCEVVTVQVLDWLSGSECKNLCERKCVSCLSVKCKEKKKRSKSFETCVGWWVWRSIEEERTTKKHSGRSNSAVCTQYLITNSAVFFMYALN